MKKTAFFGSLILTVLIYIGQHAAFAQDNGIEFFQGTWQEVLDKAQEENKPIFVDAYAHWCGPCKWMAANVFTDSEVGEFYNENFINYKFDMEKGEGKTFAQNYSIRAYPTLLFLTPEGEVVHRILGAKPGETFIGEGKVAVKKYSDM